MTPHRPSRSGDARCAAARHGFQKTLRRLRGVLAWCCAGLVFLAAPAAGSLPPLAFLEDDTTAAPDRVQARFEIALDEARSTHAAAFAAAYQAYPEVPRGVLEAISYESTTLHHVTPAAPELDGAGFEGGDGTVSRYGLMGLVLNGRGTFKSNLALVAQLSGTPVDQIQQDPAAHLAAFAKAYALTKAQLGITTNAVRDQIPVLIALSAFQQTALGQSYALDYYVYSVLGFLGDPVRQAQFAFPGYSFDLAAIFGSSNLRLLSSTFLTASEQGVTSLDGTSYQASVEPAQGGGDDAVATWTPLPAACVNRKTWARAAPPTHIAIHRTEGGYAGAIAEFMSCANVKSTHYLISNQGQIVQFVLEARAARHLHTTATNAYAIGIEHEGFSDVDGTITGPMIRASADLVARIAARNNIPLTSLYTGPGTGQLPAQIFPIPDCIQIKAHQHFPDQTHHDPGPYWNWEDYFETILGAPPFGQVCPVQSFTECAGNFTDDNAHPSGNGNYADNRRSVFLIAPDRAQRVQLTFDNREFRMAHGDWLYIYDGECTDRAKLLGAWSSNHYVIRNAAGRLVPGSPYQPPGSLITSPGPLVTVEVRSDCAVSAPGFDGAWTALRNGQSACCPNPTHFRPTNVTSSSVSLSWRAVEGAQFYDVQVKRRTDPLWPRGFLSTPDTTARFDGLQAATEYQFRIRSFCGGNNHSAYSTALAVTCRRATTVTGALTVEDEVCTNCLSPDGLEAKNVTASTAKLDWEAVEGAGGYEAQYKRASAPDSEWSIPERVSATRLNVSGLTSGTDYVFRARTVCTAEGDTSEYSAEEGFRTTACTPPDDFRATGIDYRSAKLKWTAVEGATAFGIRYRPVEAASWTTATTSNDALPLDDLTPNTEYVAEIKTVCGTPGGDESEYDEPVYWTTVCRTPFNVAVALSSNNATITWPATDAGGYQLRYRVAGTSNWTTLNLVTNSAALNRLPGADYVVQVRSACSAVDFSEWSDEVRFTVPCIVPTGLRKVSAEENRMTVAWDSTGASSYKVEWKISGRPDSEFDSQTVDGTSFTITRWRGESELRACTDYVVQVHAICPSGVGPDVDASFGTACPNPAGPCNIIRHCKGDPYFLLLEQYTGYFGQPLFAVDWAAKEKRGGWTVRLRACETLNGPCGPWGIPLTNDDRLKHRCDQSANKHWDYLLYDLPALYSPFPPFDFVFDTEISCSGGLTSFIERRRLFRPQSLSNVTSTSARVAWEPVAGATGYVVQYGRSEAEESLSVSLGPGTTSTTLTGLAAGELYDVEVTTLLPDGSGTSGIRRFVPASAGACAVPESLSASRVTSDGALLSWDEAAGAESYSVRYALAGSSDWTTVAAPGPRLTLTALAPATSYKFRVQSACAGGALSDSSEKGTFATAGAPSSGYCAAGGSRATYEWIGEVALANLANPSGTDGGYGDYTGRVASLARGASYTVSLAPGFSFTPFSEAWRVWIDWDGDGSFDDPGELAAAPAASDGVVNGTIAVPAGARLGPTRMRVAMKFASPPNACGDLGDGEVEDYVVDVAPPAACTSSLDPTSAAVGSGGATGLTVAVTSSCAWTAVSNAPWISVAAGGSGGAGGGTVTYDVAANPGSSARSGSMTIAGLTFGVSQAAGCSSSVIPASISVGSAGTTGSTISVSSSCPWTASSGVSWITITAGSSGGAGGGTVTYDVAANPSTSSRSGWLAIAGQLVSVIQAGAPCTGSLTPASASVPSGGVGGVAIAVTSNCAWTAVSNAPWISITAGESGSGNGSVTFAVAPNTETSPRTGTMSIAGQTFTVTQAGIPCTATLSPASASVGSGGLGGATISVSATCSWTAAANVSWISITAGASGAPNGENGNHATSYSVAANPTTSSRTGTMTIAGQTFTVTQAGAPCTSSINPASAAVGAGATTGATVAVTSTCTSWTAVANATWLAVTAGASGGGNGTVTYSVAANTTSSPRTGALAIAGQTFTVTQAGAVCSSSLNPASASIGSGGATGATVAVTSNCSWTAVSNATWLSITAGASGTGNGTLTYNAAANPATSSRTGTLTIAGLTFNVTQAGAPCTVSLNPASASIGGGAATEATVAVTSNCAWTAASNAAWLTITAGASGSGNGTVTYSATANTGTSSRTGTMTIAGLTFSVTQAAGGGTAPAAPSNLSASAPAGSAVSLFWFDNSSNETSFRVERKDGNSAFGEIASLAAGTTFYSDASAALNATYTYRVRACNAAGCSGYTNEASATPTPAE